MKKKALKYMKQKKKEIVKKAYVKVNAEKKVKITGKSRKLIFVKDEDNKEIFIITGAEGNEKMPNIKKTMCHHALKGVV